ncbi:MAG: ABC transporter substrate-binding protein, partial [Chloroflexales bacterium]
PKIDGILFQTFDNTDAMVQALKVGDIDMLTSVPASAFETVKGFENVKTTAIDNSYFYELIINTVDTKRDPAPTGNPALADPAVRLAGAVATAPTPASHATQAAAEARQAGQSH